MRIENTGQRAVQGVFDGFGQAGAGAQGAQGFGEMLEGLLGGLNEASNATNSAVEKLATGEDVDIHEVMIAAEMESLAFGVALQVRNKIVEAYQEVMRMPI